MVFKASAEVEEWREEILLTKGSAGYKSKL